MWVTLLRFWIKWRKTFVCDLTRSMQLGSPVEVSSFLRLQATQRARSVLRQLPHCQACPTMAFCVHLIHQLHHDSLAYGEEWMRRFRTHLFLPSAISKEDLTSQWM